MCEVSDSQLTIHSSQSLLCLQVFVFTRTNINYSLITSNCSLVSYFTKSISPMASTGDMGDDHPGVITHAGWTWQHEPFWYTVF